MPVSVKKIGDKYRVVGPNGKPETKNGSPIDGGGYNSKEAAVDQVQAININSSKSAILRAKMNADQNKEQTQGALSQPLIVMTDGTPEGTQVTYNGAMIDFQSVCINCYDDEYDKYCDISICMKDTLSDGMEICKTIRLKK